MTVAAPPSHPPVVDDPELLFREARRRRRRRRLASGLVLVVVVAAVAIVATSGTSPTNPVARTSVPKSAPPQSVGLPTGAVQALSSAGPLAVNATGSLFVVDDIRHEVLVRLNDGKFRVVAGDGTVGYSGDGGPAMKAELSHVTDLTVGPDGDLYLADSGRVRVINQQGVIETIVSPVTTNGLVTSAAPGSEPAVSQIDSVAVSPANVVYVATPAQLYRLGPADQLVPVTAIGKAENSAYVGSPTEINAFGQIAVDGKGTIYASSLDIGWSVYKISPDGTATYLGSARGSGGTLADIQSGPRDTAYASNGPTVVRANGDQLVPFHTFGVGRGQCCFYLQDFAFSPQGALYADNLGESAFGKYQEIVSFSNDRTTTLWRRRNKD